MYCYYKLSELEAKLYFCWMKSSHFYTKASVVTSSSVLNKKWSSQEHIRIVPPSFWLRCSMHDEQRRCPFGWSIFQCTSPSPSLWPDEKQDCQAASLDGLSNTAPFVCAPTTAWTYGGGGPLPTGKNTNTNKPSGLWEPLFANSACLEQRYTGWGRRRKEMMKKKRTEQGAQCPCLQKLSKSSLHKRKKLIHSGPKPARC